MTHPRFPRRQIGPVIICPLANGEAFAHCETCGNGVYTTEDGAAYVDEWALRHFLDDCR
jgi:hypothetical protein